jgi:putative aminopeptidase FrvX
LKIAETIKDGLLVFSCWEEHGGGSVPYLIKYIYDNHKIKQALICDITWITDGVRPSEGTAISLRDHNVPRKQFLDKILTIADTSGIPYQLEVEGGGSSDGREIQLSPYPIDWCFIGAPEENVHSPKELVHKADIESMISLYGHLLQEL